MFLIAIPETTDSGEGPSIGTVRAIGPGMVHLTVIVWSVKLDAFRLVGIWDHNRQFNCKRKMLIDNWAIVFRPGRLIYSKQGRSTAAPAEL